ncbi:pyridoxal reductase [Schizosaccharomyces octosporus yFS286]|uniref:Pyridoxal reductase n=1 Tax=Schizosaccharomyces octosporus (strain yFS286) TaxID=483514 RepID=S9R5F9_SCHOY|nr:pyridoxal reductase [Schizosaccharomyces octosporus yFS286]EPX73555.1 pyridoxal reductase [Schizosaccharomyces octosporus yFS286]
MPKPNHLPTSKQAFEALDYAVEHGATFWNSDKVFLSVKGAVDSNCHPHGDEELLTTSIHNILTTLRNTKKLDLFDVGLSEASATTIRRAHAVLSIVAVEVEYSLCSREIEENDVLSTYKESNIPLIAYSPLDMGLLTDAMKKKEELERFTAAFPPVHCFDRFQPETFEKNFECLHALQALAKSYYRTLPEMALSFPITMVEGMVIPIPGATNVTLLAQNLNAVSKPLSTAQIKEIYAALEKYPIAAYRYSEQLQSILLV